MNKERQNSNGEGNLVFEVYFKGTPAQFGAMVNTFADKIRSTIEYLPFRVTHPREIVADSNPVYGRLFEIDGRRHGWLSAHSLPNGMSLLRVSATVEGWEGVKETWDLLHDEMERQGWLGTDLLNDVSEGTKLFKPKKPQKPSSLPKENPNAWEGWFEWYDNMKKAGYKCTLKDIAKEINYSEGYVKLLHARYKKEKNLT